MLKKNADENPQFQRKVAEAEELLARSMETVHDFARELRPAMLDHLGLHSALRAHCADFSNQTGIAVELTADPAITRIDGQRAEVLFRIAQEALTNVYKHAHATRASIEFSATEGALQMEITDNGRSHGRGSKHETERNPNGLGLLGMQERARIVAGTFALVSVPGGGTRVRVRVPFPENTNTSESATESAPDQPLLPPLSTSINHEKNIRIAR